ncbi:hypothetical protein A3J61_01510 [Candidatus Nomurabacteria bacterium RIFCSPHIGHO2_02_FULL_38_15]|uniref:Ribulose-phosphate 3-epimerase n=1 Tax=Candidatus Nomurabacteria bacterium RIFCSPHIGHO2_02_FULL_38_15 TaxID=1801752 RepID=A0A1F6VQR3_9BACT|nr:MAG: hypothetical protein A3J61_01510 [Candidatus Nomurabacteria bacterium RIFCSPHIGHO2_02_FULL_38_15]
MKSNTSLNNNLNNLIEIIPAIIPNDFAELTQKTKLVLGSAKIVQIDLIDGKYANNKSWPLNDLAGMDWQNILNEASGMPHWNEIDYELDLMIADIPKHFNDLVRIGPKRIVFHLPHLIGEPEKISELKDFIQNLDSYYKNELELGVAYEGTTNPQDILDLQNEIKFVQCMGIKNVGFQDQDFDTDVFGRIKFIKQNLPNHIISVDGAVDMDTIKGLYDAGVTRFVCGSVIFNDTEPRLAIGELRALLKT